MTQKLSLITTTTNLSQRKCINQILPQSTQVFLLSCIFGCYTPCLPPTTVRRTDYRFIGGQLCRPIIMYAAAPLLGPQTSQLLFLVLLTCLISLQLSFRPLVLSVIFVLNSHAESTKEGESLDHRIIYRRNFQSHKQALLRHIASRFCIHSHNTTTCMHKLCACSLVNNVGQNILSSCSLTSHYFARSIQSCPSLRPTYLASGQLTTNSTLGYTLAPLRTSWDSHACPATALVNSTLSSSILDLVPKRPRFESYAVLITSQPAILCFCSVPTSGDLLCYADWLDHALAPVLINRETVAVLCNAGPRRVLCCADWPHRVLSRAC